MIVDGDDGAVALDPSARRLLSAERVIRRHRTLRQERIAARGLPAVTRDGRSVTLLCASTAAEVTAGLEAGAEGVGLLRTELAFLAASAWPTEDEHVATLAPALARLRGLIATVRTLDFGDDKTPPFLWGSPTVADTDALASRGARHASARSPGSARARLRVLLPLVESAEQVRAVRACPRTDVSIGAMIETPGRSGAPPRSPPRRTSIGTNDLVQYALGLDRDRLVASAATAAEPIVLRLVGQVVECSPRGG